MVYLSIPASPIGLLPPVQQFSLRPLCDPRATLATFVEENLLQKAQR